MGAATKDVSELLADARAGISAWAAAVKDFRDNPIYHYLNRAWRSRGPASPWLRFLPWIPPVIAFFGIGFVIFRLISATAPSVLYDRTVLAVLGISLAVYTLWISSNLYSVARDALLLLGTRDCLSASDVRFDESVMAVRLTDREFIVAMLANLLPRIYIRWLTSPVMALAGLAVIHLWLMHQHNANESSSQYITFFGIYSQSNAIDAVHSMALHAPHNLILMFVAMLLPALIMLLWLVTLGRSLKQRWMVHLVAFSVTAAQVIWIPLGMLQVHCWKRFSGGGLSDNALVWGIFAPFIVIAVLVATLHFSKNRPWLRLLLAGATPVLCLISPAAALKISTFKMLTLHSTMYEFTNIFSWILSTFSLVNPIFLLDPFVLCIPPDRYNDYLAFEWFRVPVVLLLQLISLCICAHAARLALDDWRKDEA